MDMEKDEIWNRLKAFHDPWELTDTFRSGLVAANKDLDVITKSFRVDTRRWGWMDKDETKLQCMVLGFCGKFYPMIRASWTTTEKRVETNHVVFIRNSQQFENILGKLSEYRKEEVTDFFDSNYEKMFGELFYKLRSPILGFRKVVEDVEFDNNEWCLVENDSLQQYNWHKVMDIYTTYQEIRMYVSGVIGPNWPPMVNISDEEMKKKKGFGHKYAFKKEPEKKHA